MAEDKGLVGFFKKASGYKAIEEWGISTSALVIFLIVLLVSTIMLIVNGVYFIKVFNGSTDEDINQYWSRGGSLALAIFNIFFAILLFIEFIIILTIVLKRNAADDPACLKGLTEIGDDGLPKNPEVVKKFREAKIAFASADQNKTGYVTGIAGPGAIPADGLYIGSEYLTTEEGYRNSRNNIKDDRDKYAMYDTIKSITETDTNDSFIRKFTDTIRNYEIKPSLYNPLETKWASLPDGTAVIERRDALLDTNPPFDPAKRYDVNTKYNITNLTDKYNLLEENPRPIVNSAVLTKNVFNPYGSKTPYPELRSRRR